IARENGRIHCIFLAMNMDISGIYRTLGNIEDYRDLLATISPIAMKDVALMLAGTDPQFQGLEDIESDGVQASLKRAVQIIERQERVLEPLRKLQDTGTENQKVLSNPYFYEERVEELEKLAGVSHKKKGFRSLLTIKTTTVKGRHRAVRRIPSVSARDENFISLLTVSEEEMENRRRHLELLGRPLTVANLRKRMEMADADEEEEEEPGGGGGGLGPTAPEDEEEEDPVEKKANYLVSKGLASSPDEIDNITPQTLRRKLKRIVDSEDVSPEDLEGRGQFLEDKGIEINPQTAPLLDVGRGELSERYDFLTDEAGVPADDADLPKALKKKKETLENRHGYLRNRDIPRTGANFIRNKRALASQVPPEAKKAAFLASKGLIAEGVSIEDALNGVDDDDLRALLRVLIYTENYTLEDLKAKARLLEEAGIEISGNTVVLFTVSLTILAEKIRFLIEEIGLTGEEEGFVGLLGTDKIELSMRHELLKRHRLEITVENLLKTRDEVISQLTPSGQKAEMLVGWKFLSRKRPVDESLRRKRPRELRELLERIINSDEISLRELSSRIGILSKLKIKVNSKTAHLLEVPFSAPAGERDSLFSRSDFLVHIIGLNPDEVDFTPLMSITREELEERYGFFTRYNLQADAEGMGKTLEELNSTIPMWGARADFLAGYGLLPETGSIISAVRKTRPKHNRKMLEKVIDFNDRLDIDVEKLKNRAEFLEEKEIEITFDALPLLLVDVDELRERYRYLTEELEIDPGEKGFLSLLATPKRYIEERHRILVNYEFPVNVLNLAKTKEQLQSDKPSSVKKAERLSILRDPRYLEVEGEEPQYLLP
ncbi:MAG: hypothetical protein ACE5JK_07440, partial [Candidatus Omnitrophota bacterium]